MLLLLQQQLPMIETTFNYQFPLYRKISPRNLFELKFLPSEDLLRLPSSTRPVAKKSFIQTRLVQIGKNVSSRRVAANYVFLERNSELVNPRHDRKKQFQAPDQQRQSCRWFIHERVWISHLVANYGRGYLIFRLDVMQQCNANMHVGWSARVIVSRPICEALQLLNGKKLKETSQEFLGIFIIFLRK